MASLASHLLEFSAVIIPKSFLLDMIAMYWVSLKLLMSAAVPKYILPALTMSECRPSCDWDCVPFCVVTAAAAAALANSSARASLAILAATGAWLERSVGRLVTAEDW